jgi:hypothetical protein
MVSVPSLSELPRWLVSVVMFAYAVVVVMTIAGGPDLLGDWFLVPWAVAYLVWGWPELRTDELRWIRWSAWIGLVGCVGMIIIPFAELLF